jgi:nucleoside diphosphate kinase
MLQLAKELFLIKPTSIMGTIEFGNIISTLITSGFHISKVERVSGNNQIINAYKFDRLGAQIRYSLLFSELSETDTLIKYLQKIAKRYNSLPIIISDKIKTTECQSYTNDEFYKTLGGYVNTGIILIPNLSVILNDLGHNNLPLGLTGEPDDLHEIYIAECLQFIMSSPTKRYGIDRLFESLPDGVVLGKDKYMILLDSKAYSKGFDFSSDDIKRFASYISDFSQRYSSFFGSIFSFVVVSGEFNDSINSIENRSEELYKLSNCRISCIESKILGEIVELIKSRPEIRLSINWKNIFTETMVETKHVLKEIKRIEKDKIH